MITENTNKPELNVTGLTVGKGIPEKTMSTENPSDSLIRPTDTAKPKTRDFGVSAVIAAVIAAAATTTAAAVNKKQVDETNQIAIDTYNQEREDSNKITAFNQMMTKQQLKMQKEQMKWQKQQARKDRAERASDKAYSKRRNFLSDSLAMVNQNTNLRNLTLSALRRA